MFRATPDDAAELDAFLAQHAATSMFLRGNLEAHGTQELAHRHGTTFFVKRQGNQIVAVAGITNGGYLMCQAPDQPDAFWADTVACMQGRQVMGITGVPEQTAAWATALGLGDAQFKINKIEPLFEAPLAQIAAVPAGFTLRKPAKNDAAMLADWFEGYHRDTGMKPAQGAVATELAQTFIAHPDARIGMVDDRPVAMTSINARALDVVQVGGVYVPPAARRQGYGGAVVAAHLAELATAGTKTAILFAANDFAARAYLRVGFVQVGSYFVQVGSYRVALLNTPVTVGEARAELGLGER